MRYKIWNEEEKKLFMKKNNKEIIKSSIKFAIAVAISFGCMYALNKIPLEKLNEVIRKAIVLVGGIVGASAIMTTFMDVNNLVREADKIEDGYTDMYDEEDIKGRSK